MDELMIHVNLMVLNTATTHRRLRTTDQCTMSTTATTNSEKKDLICNVKREGLPRMLAYH
jgi:hypothetical protein